MGEFAREVLSLPGTPDAQRQAMRHSADGVYQLARTVDGYYCDCWSGAGPEAALKS